MGLFERPYRRRRGVLKHAYGPHFIEQFGPACNGTLTKLMDVPEKPND